SRRGTARRPPYGRWGARSAAAGRGGRRAGSSRRARRGGSPRAAVRARACRLADLPPELVGPPHALALPERHGARDSRGGRDEHAVAGDLLDPPGGGAEHERLPLAGLVDHLLVELPHPAAVADLEHAVEASVGDRARVRHREPPRALTSADHARGAVPDDPWAQLRELVRGVAAG